MARNQLSLWIHHQVILKLAEADAYDNQAHVAQANASNARRDAAVLRDIQIIIDKEA